MMRARVAEDRSVLRLSGADVRKFLQDLVSNDVEKLGAGLVYAALLSPQGKYLFDFFMAEQGDAVLLDVKADAAPALMQRLNMYKLRADVAVEVSDIPVVHGVGEVPEGALADPRGEALGWRLYGADMPECGVLSEAEWLGLRVEHCVPETGVELLSGEGYVLELGFERLGGVDFRKGCYVGQEVTARMKHKTALKKGLAVVTLDGAAPEPGTPILRDGRAVGVLYSAFEGRGIAYLRFERAGAGMVAGEASVGIAE